MGFIYWVGKIIYMFSFLGQAFGFSLFLLQ